MEEEAPADTDVVNFIVELKGEPLLAAGFSADEIAAQSASVTNYQDKQLVNINGLKTRLTNRFGSDENCVTLMGRDGRRYGIGPDTKRAVAEAILEIVTDSGQ